MNIFTKSDQVDKRTKKRLAHGLCAILALIGCNAHAAFIGGSSIAPSTSLPSIGGFTINKIADGIDLNTDLSPFNGFVASAAAGTITLDLVGDYNLTAFILANDVNVRAEGVKDFRLDFYSAANVLISSSGTLTAPFNQVSAQTYFFSAVNGVSKVNLVVLSSFPSTLYHRIEIREVAFEGTPADTGTSGPCNTVTSQTNLPPDAKSTVFVTLNQDDPSTAASPDFVCKVQFDTPPDSSWTTTTKCDALVNAISSSTQCMTAGFTISNNSCSLLQSFTVTGSSASTAVSMGISNTGFDQNQDNTGAPLPNYERETLTPGCTGAAGGPGTETAALLAVKGVATGVSFIAGQPSAVEVTVDQTNNGGQIQTARVVTVAGMTAASIVSGLNTQLAQRGVSCSLVTSPFSAIKCVQRQSGSQQLTGQYGAQAVQLADGFGISTSDTGVGVGNASGPGNTILAAFNGPFVEGDVPLPLAALVSLGGLLAGTGFLVNRRRRK